MEAGQVRNLLLSSGVQLQVKHEDSASERNDRPQDPTAAAGTYPGEDGEEAEDDGGSGSVSAFFQRVVLRFRHLPLIGQKTEAHEPEERPESCTTTRNTR